MRKVLSLVLSLALVFGSFSFAFAATTTAKTVSDVAGTQYEDAVRVLMSLDIVTGYSDGTYKPAGAVTRAEMAALIVRALGLDTTSTFVAKSNYSDMAGNWADKYVALVSGKNIVKGYPDGTFKPNAQVSYPEAITMIVRALGYTDGCTSLTGTWPANYMTLATDLDITDNVKVVTSATADRGAVAILLYNALDVPNVTVDKEDMSATKVEIDDEDGNYLTFLSKLDVVEDDMTVNPDDVDDEDTLCDLSGYVYAHITAYLNDDDQIIGVKELTEDDGDTVYASVTGEFDADDETVTTADDDEYDIDAMTTSTDIYLNGEETSYAAIDGTDDLLDGMQVKVYGAYEDGEDSDVFTTIYGIIATVPTGEYIADSDTVSDIADIVDDGNGDIFDVELPTVDDDGDELDTADITVKGDATSLSDIKADDVITVYASADLDEPDKVTFAVKRATAEVKVKKVNEDDNEVIGTDGKAYIVASAEYNTGVTTSDAIAIDDFEIGTTYTAYLDEFGYIFDAEDIDDAGPANYAVVVSVKAGDDFDDAQMKLFTQAGDSTTFDVDDDAYDTTTIGGLVSVGDVIEYDTNSAGDIDEITVLTDELAAYDVFSAEDTEYKSSSDTYNSEDIASDAVFFDLSGDTTVTVSALGVVTGEDDDWDVISKLTNGSEYTAHYYVNVEDDEIAVVLITESDDTNNNYLAANSKSKAQDADEDDVFAIDGFLNGTAITDKLTTDNTVYSAPSIFVVDLDGDALDNPIFFKNINNTASAAAIFGTGYDIVTNAAVTSSGTSDYFKANGGVQNLADDAIIYVAVYDDGDLDSYKVGKIGDIDAGDYVTYVLNDDGDVEFVVVTDNDDLQDAHNDGDVFVQVADRDWL